MEKVDQWTGEKEFKRMFSGGELSMFYDMCDEPKKNDELYRKRLFAQLKKRYGTSEDEVSIDEISYRTAGGNLFVKIFFKKIS